MTRISVYKTIFALYAVAVGTALGAVVQPRIAGGDNLGADLQSTSSAHAPDSKKDFGDHGNANLVDRIFSGGHRIPFEVSKVVKRGLQDADDVGDLAVSKAELARLIQDIRTIKSQLLDMLEPSSSGTPSGDVHAETASITATIIIESSTPVLAPNVSIPNPPDLIEATELPLIDGVLSSEEPEDDLDGFGLDPVTTTATTSINCTTTVTQIVTEYLYNGPSTSTSAPHHTSSETGGLLAAASGLSALPIFPLGFDAGVSTSPTWGTSVTTQTVEISVIPLGFFDKSQAVSASTLEDFGNVAEPTATASPAAISEPSSEQESPATSAAAEISGGYSSSSSTAGNEAAIPTDMTLRFPDGNGDGIVWKTIVLPTV